MTIKTDLSKTIKKQLNQEISLEIPPTIELGDFALHCFKLKIPPDQMIKKLKLPKYIEKTEIKGPYLNFFIKKDYLAKKVITEILKNKSKYGSEKSKHKSIVIDYSSPNVAKPFSIAHLRSTAIGNSLYRISKKLGYKAIGINYIADWGTQFGKLIYAYKTWGSETELKKDPINHCLQIYVKFHEEVKNNPLIEEEGRKWFAKLEKGDLEAKKLWKLFVELSLREFNKIYKKLDIKFDYTMLESTYGKKLDFVIDLLKSKKLLELDQGALVVKLDKYNIPPCIIKKSDEASIYASRDIASAIDRYKRFNFSKALYVVDSRQSLHFQQFFKVLELAGFEWAKNLSHIKFGLMTFEDGVMSTREGKIIFMEDVLNQAEAKVLEIIKEKNPNLKNKEKIASQIGIGAILFWDLSNDRVRDIAFSWGNILDFQGGTGPYIQYTNVRACSILKNQQIPQIFDFSLINTKQEQLLINQLNNYNEVINQSFVHFKPSILAIYLIRLSQLFNEFYSACPVLTADTKLKNARIALVMVTHIILEDSLSLLGINSPSEM